MGRLVKLLISFLLITILAYADVKDEIIYKNSNDEIIMDLDKIQYFQYKGYKLTLSGIINEIISEKKNDIIEQIMNLLKGENGRR